MPEARIPVSQAFAKMAIENPEMSLKEIETALNVKPKNYCRVFKRGTPAYEAEVLDYQQRLQAYKERNGL